MRLLALLLLARAAAGWDGFLIRCVDEETGRGVPLVELTTLHGLSLVSDSNGLVAFDEPGLMDRNVYFQVRSHGYEIPKNFLEDRAVAFETKRGGTGTVRLKRLIVAERLYRTTGAGIYLDTVRAGLPAPIRQPLLNGGVLGQDSVLNAIYRGRLWWFWGDTAGAANMNFGGSGATSDLPGRGGLDPSAGVDLTYFTDAAGFSKPVCPKPEKGLRWIAWLATLGEGDQQRLYARYAVMKDLGEALEWDFAVWDDAREQFEILQRYDAKAAHWCGHIFPVRAGAETWLYIQPWLRMRPDLASLREPAKWQAWTPLRPGVRFDADRLELDRDESGRIRYGWREGTDPVEEDPFRKLEKAGLRAGENWIHLLDIETGKPVWAGRGAVAWNAWRKRWIMITGIFGDIWYAEAETPVGPWCWARRVVWHDHYTFYNPKLHPYFDQEGGRLVYFEGTYTAAFSDAKVKTPRYDYNQVMYRLRLDDPRLFLPAPVYRGPGGPTTAFAPEVAAIEFFALPADRPAEGSVPVRRGDAEFRAMAKEAPGTFRLEPEGVYVWSNPYAFLPADGPCGPG